MSISDKTNTDSALVYKEETLVHFLISSALFLFFAFDGVTKFLFVLEMDFTRASVFIRAIYELLFLLIIIFFLNRDRLTFISLFFVLLLLFILGQVMFAFSIDKKISLVDNLLMYNKYFFVFVIYFAIYKIVHFPQRFKSILKNLELLFILNSVLIIFGFIFEIVLFKSYFRRDSRFGYNGLIYAQNEATLFYLIAISYYYYNIFILKIRSNSFYLILAGSLLLGTKAIYLFLLMILVYHFVSLPNFFKKIKIVFLSLLSLPVLLFIIDSNRFKHYYQYFHYFIVKKGLIFTLLSGRNLNFEIKFFEVLSNWNFYNYLFGGHDVWHYLIEMDFIDLFLFLGLIGGSIYLYYLFNTLFKFKLARKFHLFFISSYLILAFFGGHFFYSVLNALYLCIICLFFYMNDQRLQKDFANPSHSNEPLQ